MAKQKLKAITVRINTTNWETLRGLAARYERKPLEYARMLLSEAIASKYQERMELDAGIHT